MNETNEIMSLVQHAEARDFFSESKDAQGLNELAAKILGTENLVGSSDDFFNFAIELARLKDYDMACHMFKRGIDRYESSVDLLAGYLLYGIDCDHHKENCAEYYNKLCSIPDKDWTWRGYSFSLDYLQTRKEMAGADNQQEKEWCETEIVRLIEAFRLKYKGNERVYLAEARLYSSSEPEKEFRILEEAVNTLSNCPRCAYRYVELLIDRADGSDDYKKALAALKKALKIKPDNTDVNVADVYFLQGLCLIEIERENDNGDIDEDKAIEIFRLFQMAQSDYEELTLSPKYKRVFQREKAILEKKTKMICEDV